MTYDLKVILKYCGRSSYDILALIVGCPWRWSWSLCGRSWVALGAYVSGLGLLLEPLLAVLSCSWRLCWRSWAVLGRKVAQTRAGRRSGRRTWAEK